MASLPLKLYSEYTHIGRCCCSAVVPIDGVFQHGEPALELYKLRAKAQTSALVLLLVATVCTPTALTRKQYTAAAVRSLGCCARTLLLYYTRSVFGLRDRSFLRVVDIPSLATEQKNVFLKRAFFASGPIYSSSIIV